MCGQWKHYLEWIVSCCLGSRGTLPVLMNSILRSLDTFQCPGVGNFVFNQIVVLKLYKIILVLILKSDIYVCHRHGITKMWRLCTSIICIIVELSVELDLSFKIPPPLSILYSCWQNPPKLHNTHLEWIWEISRNVSWNTINPT